MALPAILSRGHMELLKKSESELLDMIQASITLAAVRCPKQLIANKQRLILNPLKMAGDDTDDDTATDSTKAARIRIKIVKKGIAPQPESTNIDDSSSNSATTSAADVGKGKGNKSVGVIAALKEEEEYEKRLDSCKRKLRDGYSEFQQSRKMSKVVNYVPTAAVVRKKKGTTATGNPNPNPLRRKIHRGHSLLVLERLVKC